MARTRVKSHARSWDSNSQFLSQEPSDFFKVHTSWWTEGRAHGGTTSKRNGLTCLTRFSIIVSMLACPRCSELPSVWLSSRFFMIAMVCSTNWVLVSFSKTCRGTNHAVKCFLDNIHNPAISNQSHQSGKMTQHTTAAICVQLPECLQLRESGTQYAASASAQCSQNGSQPIIRDHQLNSFR